jgi:filamentous hemagglutinin family protein
MRTIITTACIAALLVNTTPLAYANPVGGNVVGGRGATITGQGTASTTINQSANKVIINWQDFSIGAGEVTRFIQPSATAAALNRVVSGNPSLIYGQLSANGRVFVINPNGILVGPSGQIDTKSFVASTLNVRNADFMSKQNLIFSGDSAAGIRNEGAIQALGGDVFLIAHTVDNAGTINAAQGTVGLAAGSQVQLMQAGNERISVIAGNSSAPADKGVNNSGTIAATSAELKAAGGNIYALAINNGGVVRADGIVQRNGHIYLGATGGNIENSGTLTAHNADGSGGTIHVEGGHNADAPATVINSGTIEARGNASGTQGGDVRLLGDHVGLNNNALVDVSGDAGGGTALIGGDYHGGNSAVQNAERAYVGPDAVVRADAISQGNGGKVVVWSDDVTRFYGNISSRGGALGGDGGFVEVSGHNSLVYRGQVDLQSPVGFMGTLLLDPKFIVIAIGGPDSVAGNDDFAENPTGTSTISPANLVTALNSANVTLRANTDITITDTINASAGAANDLILRAGRSIIDNANITLAGAFDATINDSGATSANRDPGAAAFTMAGGTTITAPGGISIQGGTLAADSSGATSIDVNTGDISLQNLNSSGLPVGASTAGKTGGAISIVNNAAAGKDITISGTIDSRGSDAVGGGNHAGGSGGTVTLNASGTLSINAINTSAGDGVGTGNGGDAGDVLATGTGGITLNNNITSLAGAGSPAGLNGNQTFNNAVTVGNDSILNGRVITFSSTINGAHNLTVTGSGAPVFGAAIGGTTPLSSFTVNSAAAFTFNRDVTASAVSLNAGTDGTGSLDFAAGVDINADSQTYRAGDGLGGGGAAATVDLSGNTPNFRNSAGSAEPVNFTYRQDASIADADIPSAARFGGTAPTTYTIQSDEGTLTISTGSKVAGSALSLIAADALAINGSLTLASIQAQSGSDGVGNMSFGAGVQVNADSQTYRAGDGVAGAGTGANVNLTGNNPDFRNTAGAAAPTSFTYRQDGAIADTDIPAAARFGGTQPGAYTIRSDDGGVQLPAMTLPGTLQVIANGDITQSGALDVSSGSSTFTINTALNADVLLGQANHFAGQSVTINSINLGSVHDVTFRNVDATAVFPTVPIILHNLTIQLDAAAATLPSLTLSGNLDVTAGGLISDSGNLAITGTTTLDAGAGNDITLNNGNDFGGAVSITSGQNVTLVDINALTLGVSTVSGNLNASASGLISDSGNLTITGTTTLAAGAANDITLNNNNDFGGAVSITTGHNVTLNDINALILGASTISGNLNVTTAGLISDSGNLSVIGTTTLAAGSGNDITLDNADDFGGAVSITSGNNVTLNDINALTLGASTVSGNLNATANGLISDGGAVTVNGTTTLAAGAGNDITLDNANNFVGAVSVTSGRNVTLNDVNALTLGASIVSGTLNVTASGLISDSGNLSVIGTTTLAAGAGNDITLNNANDFGGAVSITSGRNVTLVDVNAISLGASTVSGTLAVTASGNISETGALTVTGGSSTFTIDTALNADVLLGSQANHFGSQSVTINTINGGTIRDVSFRNVDASAAFPTLPAGLRNLTVRFDNAAAALPALTLSGNLDVTANGLISDGGNLTVNGTTLLAAGVGNDITLNNANDFVGAVSVTSGRNVTLNDINALTLGASAVSGNLNVTAGGLISDSGNLTVNGTTTLATSPLTDITLDNANDFVGAVSITSGQNVTLNDVNALVAGASTVSGNLELIAGAAVTQTGDISAPGLSVKAGGPITLDGNNNVGTLAALVTGAGAISFTGVGSLTIGTVNAVSGLKTANGAITVNSDTLQISQAIDSGTARTILNPKTAGQSISLGTETPGELSLTDAELDLVNAGVLQVGSATAGAIDINGAISPANANVLTLINNGAVTENAAGSINVNNLRVSSVGSVNLVAPNDVNTLAIASSGAGNGISFRDVNDVTIGTVDTVNGVTANNGPVFIGAGNNLTVNNTPATADVDAGTSTVELVSSGGTLTVATGADVHGDAKVTLTSDAMTINGTVRAASTGNDSDINLVVQPASPAQNISLGIEDGTRLSLTQSELDKFTGNALQVGNTGVGDISGAGNVVAPVGVAKLLLVSSANTIEVFNSQLAGLLAGAILPVPKVEIASFSAASISADEAAKLKVPGSISVLFLELKFPPTKERKYKIEDISKWANAGIAVSGDTSGPQQGK